MNMKISKLLITLLVITLGTVYANNTMSINNPQEKVKVKHYTQMSTSELQIEVEKLSNQGKLPFEMGLELMNRWTETKKEVN